MAYLGNTPDSIVKKARKAYVYTASAGQTVFTGSDLNGDVLDCTADTFANVYLNGVRLIKGLDFTLSLNSLALTVGAALDDEITIVCDVEAAVFNTYTRSEIDARVSGSVPVGTVVARLSSLDTPSGWVAADGSIVSGALYPNLTPLLAPVSAISGGTTVPTSVIYPSASSFIDVRSPDKANDGITNETDGGWHSNYENNPWLQFQFTDAPRVINAYRIYARTDGFQFGSDGFSLYGSNNGFDFTLIDTKPQGSNAPNGGYKDHAVDVPGSYSYYRIQSNTSYYQTIAEWQLFTGAVIQTQYVIPQISYPPSGTMYIIKT